VARTKKAETETQEQGPILTIYRRPYDQLECLGQRGRGDHVISFTNRRQLTIEWGQCDPAGIVFNSRFFELFDSCTWHLFQAALGVKPHELKSTFGIMGIPLVDVRANFIKPIKFGDIVDTASRVSEFRRSSFDVEHHLLVNGELAVEGSETRVWVTRRKDNPEKVGGASIPGDVIAKFKVA